MRNLIVFLLICVFVVPMWSNGMLKGSSLVSQIVVDRFEQLTPVGKIPPGWYEYRFNGGKNPTTYSVVPADPAEKDSAPADPGNLVLKAEANCGSSLIGKEFPVDLHEYPVLSWRWKVERVIEGADGRTKEGNDFPARVYVAVKPKGGFNPFRSLANGVKNTVAGVPVPEASINFVWSSKYGPGETFSSPSSDSAKVVVIEGGETRVGKWVEVRVNVLDYYNQFFQGGPAKVEGVAVMSDSDNTESQVVAYYDDIVFSRPGKASGN